MRVDQNGDGKPDGVLQNTILPGGARSGYLWSWAPRWRRPTWQASRRWWSGARHPPRRGGGYPGRHGPQAQAGRVGQRAPHRRPLRRRDSGRRGCPEKGPQLARGGHPGVGRGSGAAGPGRGAPARKARRRPGLGLCNRARARGLRILLPAVAGSARVAGRFADWHRHAGVPGAATGPGARGIRCCGAPCCRSARWPCSTARVRCARRWQAWPSGVAGGLLFAACAYTADIRFVPDVLDRAWLAVNAFLATGLGALVLRR